MNNFPAMTEERRQQAIKDFTFRAVNTDCDVSLLAYQIAIAALSSTPASREIIQASLYANRPLYTAPPAPVLKPIELPKNTWKPCDCIDCVIAYDRDDVIAAIRAAGYEVKL